MHAYDRYIFMLLICTWCVVALYKVIFDYNHEEINQSPRAMNSDKDLHESLVVIESHDTKYEDGHKMIEKNDLKMVSRGYPTNFVKYDQDKRHSLMQYLQSRIKTSQFDFSRCSMLNCFNFSRCMKDGPLKVHIVPSKKSDQVTAIPGESNMIHQKILKIIKNSKHYEPDERKACIFVLEDDTLDRDPLSSSFKPNLVDIFGSKQMYGMNHLVFNLYSGTWPDYRENDFAGLQFGAAIVAKASNSITYHRPMFDISLPLFSYQHPTTDPKQNRAESVPQPNRTFFLTFKGKRYVIGKGSETRNNLYHIDNQRDVIMLTTCRHGKKWKESSDSRCLTDEANYDKHDFVDLMKKSTFCLTPRGRRLGSFRHLEAMSFGCIPVILSDGWVKPFDEIIDWSSATVEYAENSLLLVPDMLRDIDISKANKMRDNCLNLYNKYFSSIEKIILTTLEIVERRIKNQINTS